MPFIDLEGNQEEVIWEEDRNHVNGSGPILKLVPILQRHINLLQIDSKASDHLSLRKTRMESKNTMKSFHCIIYIILKGNGKLDHAKSGHDTLKIRKAD